LPSFWRKVVIDDATLRIDIEEVAEEAWPPELAHHGMANW